MAGGNITFAKDIYFHKKMYRKGATYLSSKCSVAELAWFAKKKYTTGRPG